MGQGQWGRAGDLAKLSCLLRCCRQSVSRAAFSIAKAQTEQEELEMPQLHNKLPGYALLRGLVLFEVHAIIR